jgi:hypothetical protein
MANRNPNTSGLKPYTQKPRSITDIYQHYAVKGRVRRRRSSNSKKDPFRWLRAYEEYLFQKKQEKENIP